MLEEFLCEVHVYTRSFGLFRFFMLFVIACVCARAQAVMRSSPIVVALATFAAYVLSGHELDAETAFTSLALFGVLGHPFHVLPKVRE